MINKKYLNSLRTRNKKISGNFIYNKIADRIIDSIDLLNINFRNILELGINDKKITNYLQSKFRKCEITKSDIINYNFKDSLKNKYIKIEFDNYNLNNKYFDLIFSNNFIQIFNDFENIFKVINKSLNSNGFFIAAIPCQNNIYQLVNSMYETDNFLYGGMYQRVNPILDINDIFKILKFYNFDAPLINTNNFTIGYSVFKKLLDDVRFLNLSYSGIDKRNYFENKKYFVHLEKQFKKNYYDENFNLDINYNTICAWKK